MRCHCVLTNLTNSLCTFFLTGVKGAYYGGKWVDIEDCGGTFQPDSSKCSGCPEKSSCPRSQSRNAAESKVEVSFAA